MLVSTSHKHNKQIFLSIFRGWGLRCVDDVPNGGFICIYAGQLLSEEGADQVRCSSALYQLLDKLKVGNCYNCTPITSLLLCMCAINNLLPELYFFACFTRNA